MTFVCLCLARVDCGSGHQHPSESPGIRQEDHIPRPWRYNAFYHSLIKRSVFIQKMNGGHVNGGHMLYLIFTFLVKI